jgi:hypothetical protein
MMTVAVCFFTAGTIKAVGDDEGGILSGGFRYASKDYVLT